MNLGFLLLLASLARMLDTSTFGADFFFVSARDAEGWTAAMVAAFRNPANVRLQAVLIDRAASS